MSDSGDAWAMCCSRTASTPTAETSLGSLSTKVTTHFTTETSVPTYMNSAIARNQNEALRKRPPASLNGNDSGWTGLGNLGTTTRTSSTVVKIASTQKIVLNEAS